MNAFSDDDLKRLKEKILDGDFTSQETSDLEALLARLEAAEKALLTAHVNCYPPKGEHCKGCDAYSLWRKAAGK